MGEDYATVHDALTRMRDKLAEQAGTIASLHKSNDEMAVLISSQEYTIRKLRAELEDRATPIPKPNDKTADNIRDVATFEDDNISLLEKMQERKRMLSMTPAERGRAALLKLARERERA